MEPDRLPNWHFTVLAPFYDFFLSLRPGGRADGLIEEQSAVLDLGGGTGRSLAGAHANGVQPYRAVVVDVNRSMMKRGTRTRGYHFVEADALRLPLADASFKHVLVHDALHHIGFPETVFAEIYRVLEPGGRLWLEEVNVDRLLGRTVRLVEKLVGMRSRFWGPDELVRLAQEAGFELLSRDAGAVIQRLNFLKPSG